MRYISLWITGILLLSLSCNEVDVRGNGTEMSTLNAGFRDSIIEVFENVDTNFVHIDFSQPLVKETKIRIEIANEHNICEWKDYFIPEKEFVVPIGAKSLAVAYVLVDNHSTNDRRGFILKLAEVDKIAIDEKKTFVYVKVLDDESDVAVGFEHTDTKCLERQNSSIEKSYVFHLPVKLSGHFTKPIQFKVAIHALTDDNPAVENVHFRLQEQTFVIDQADGGISIPIEIKDDDMVNIDRKFAIDIVEVVNAELIVAQKRCVVTIINDDLGIYFEKTKLTVEERAGKIKIPVKLTDVADQELNFVLTVNGDATEDIDYALTKVWTIQQGKDGMEIEVDIKHVVGIAPDRMVTFTFANIGAGLSVLAEQATCDLTILDVDTPLEFKYEEWGVIDMRGTLRIPIVLQEVLTHDVSFKLKINEEEGVNVTVEAPEAIIIAGQTTTELIVKVNQLATKSFSMSLIEVKGATASTRKALVSQCGEIAKPQGLTIESFSSQAEAGEPAGCGVAAAAIDGDEATYWHSEWTPNNTKLPQHIIIKIPEQMHVAAVDVLRRVSASNSDTKKAEIYLSREQNTWELQGSLEWAASTGTDRTQHLRKQVFNHVQKGGYIKINVTEGFRQYGQVGEVIVYGYIENKY